jgi:hypothetical protein
MKSVYQCCRGAAFIACCLLGACHVVSNEAAASGGDEGSGEAGSGAAAGSEPRGGSSATGGKHAGGASGAGSSFLDLGAAGQAGAGNEAGGTGEAGEAASGASGSNGGANPQTAALDPETAECDVDGGGCVSKCVHEVANCGVESFAFACEFDLFHDMPAAMTCGQSVTVGIANCGLCGAVAVKLYYDGSYCWQGVPDCAGQSFGRFVDPHAPLP